jgi:hypothetical protein
LPRTPTPTPPGRARGIKRHREKARRRRGRVVGRRKAEKRLAVTETAGAGVFSQPPNGMISAASVRVLRFCSTVVTLPPSVPSLEVLTLCNANDSPDVTGIALMTEVTGGVMYVVDLATNRSDVYSGAQVRGYASHRD